MKKNHEDVIACLQKQTTPISSTQLAEFLQVSSRSIKHYIQEINAIHPGCILSSKQGYLLAQQKEPLLKSEHIPQTYSERASYIIKEFFVKQVESMDIYALCDDLFLSYSSVKSLLQRMNQEYKNDHIRFTCKNDNIQVLGTQRDQRRFLTNTLYREAKGNLIDMNVLKQMFPMIDVGFIDALLHERFKQATCYINDFGYMNLNLHITVMLHSILTKQDHEMAEKVLLTTTIEDQIIAALQQHFHIKLHQSEAEEMRTMIQMNIHMCQINSEEELIASIGKEIYVLCKELIHALNKQYHLDLQEQTLLLPLSLHLKNLMERLAHQTTLHNPLLDTLQSSCPLLFDCALYAADFLYQKWHIEINKDEIAYIAMHIGADIERLDEDVHKLRCILLCPDFQETRSHIYNYLLIHFDAQIQILQCVSFQHEIQEQEYDVLFTTIPIEDTHFVITIPPFPSTKNLAGIFHSLEAVLELRKRKILWQEFDQFFSPALFYYDASPSMEKKEILKLLCDKCWKNGHVSSTFFQDVCNRDEAASTAFGRIAIPHSMKMDAIHTKVALAISPQGFLWDEQVVNIVLLIAINEKDSHLFKELYEALISFFHEDTIMTLIKESTTFAGFKEIIRRFSV